MKTLRHVSLVGLPLLAVSLASAGLLRAQAPAAPRSTSPAIEAAEVITLPEFSVTSTAATEYTSAESTTGTRVASKIQDLPFTVNVITGELLDDFNALEFRDQMSFTSNVTAYETVATGYSVRGFDADVQLRNGFRRIGLIDKVNVERVEIIKGPAASIYGAVTPGGTVNIITRKPQTKPRQRVTFTLGDYDLYRSQLSTTGPLGSSRQLFYSIDAAADTRTYGQKFKEKNQSTVSAQLLWKPARTTSLLVEAEWLERRERGISQASTPFQVQTLVLDPYRVQPATGAARTYTRYVAIALDQLDFNVQGPHNFSNRYVKNLTATFEHRLTDVFSLRSSANWFDRGAVRQEVGGRDQFNPVTRTVQRGTARYRPFPEGGITAQNDLLASFATGAVKHKLLFTLDYQRQTQQPEQFDAAVNAAFAPATATGLNVDNPNYSFASYIDNPSLYSVIQKGDDSVDIYGAFLSERATFIDGRLIALAGLRYDSVRNIARSVNLGTRTESTSSAVTHQAGLNFRVLRDVTLYANTSKSFVPQFGSGFDAAGNRFSLPNQNGRGWETGVKSSLFDSRLTFTAGYFDIKLDNIVNPVTDADTGRLVTLVTGKQASTGYELDFNWALVSGLQLFGGYGNTKSVIESSDAARHLIGTPTRRTPRQTFGIGGKYDVKDGPLKGVYLTLGYKYNAKSLPNPSTGRALTASVANPIVNNLLPNGLLPFPNSPHGALITVGATRVNDGRESIYNAPYSVFDAGLGYKFKTAKRYSHKLQLNVSNLADKRYTFGSNGQGDRRMVSTTYDLSF